MSTQSLQAKAERYLRQLCEEIDNRATGSPGNREATDFFAESISSFGFTTESPTFSCLDWDEKGAALTVAGNAFPVFPSPYTRGCHVETPLAVAETIEELAAAELAGKVLLMRGTLTHEQLMPKNFPFYNPEHHRELIQLLEIKKPAAIVTATGRDVQMVGSQYPFPLFEDGDFDIPSVYLKDVEGDRLAEYGGREVCLEIRAERISAHACNVVARKGPTSGKRVVLFAHVDAKRGTPGALDNAAGVSVMLLLAELLADYSGKHGIEIVALNGEDYFSNPGEQEYLAQNQDHFDEIVLGINVDGVGSRKGKVAFSLYECPQELAHLIEELFTEHPQLVSGEPWFQGDHALFVLNQVPSLAFTSEKSAELLAEIVHTEKDRPELIDTVQLVALAEALHDLLLTLGRRR